MGRKNKQIVAVRIYLKFAKDGGNIHIKQVSKNIDGDVFLVRRRRVRKPFEKHMKIALHGTIQTTINYCRKHQKKKVTHIGIYLSDILAIDILRKKSMPNYLKNGIKLIIVQKEF